MADDGRGDSLGVGIRLAMTPIVGVLPFFLPTDAVPEDWRSVFWVTPMIVVGVVYLIRPGGVFSRERLGPTLLGRITAGLLAVGYVVGTVLVLAAEAQLFWATLVVGSLYASALLLVRAAHPVEWADAAASLAMVLAGVGCLLSSSWVGDQLLGFAVLLLGCAVLLFGVAFLQAGGLLRRRALLLGGVAGLLVAVSILRDGNLVGGVGVLLMGVGVLLFGVTDLLGGGMGPRVVAVLLLGVAVLPFGVAALWVGELLMGAGWLLIGVALLLFGVAGLLVGGAGRIRAGYLLMGAGGLVGGAGGLLAGVAFLQDGAVVVGVGVLLVGVAFLLFGVEALRDGHVWPPARRWVEQVMSLLTRQTETEVEVSSGEGSRQGGECG